MHKCILNHVVLYIVNNEPVCNFVFAAKTFVACIQSWKHTLKKKVLNNHVVCIVSSSSHHQIINRSSGMKREG